jgi:hypothetical protein
VRWRRARTLDEAMSTLAGALPEEGRHAGETTLFTPRSREAVADELGDAAGGGRVEVREHRDHVARLRIPELVGR